MPRPTTAEKPPTLKSWCADSSRVLAIL